MQKYFCSVFGSNENFKFCFPDLLTFSMSRIELSDKKLTLAKILQSNLYTVITGHILKLAGKWGAPFTGILGSALTVGSKLLNPNPNVASCLSVTHIEDGFKEVSNNLPIIQIQVCFLLLQKRVFFSTENCR